MITKITMSRMLFNRAFEALWSFIFLTTSVLLSFATKAFKLPVNLSNDKNTWASIPLWILTFLLRILALNFSSQSPSIGSLNSLAGATFTYKFTISIDFYIRVYSKSFFITMYGNIVRSVFNLFGFGSLYRATAMRTAFSLLRYSLPTFGTID